MKKLRITVDVDVKLIKGGGRKAKTIKEIKNGIILYPDDVVDGFIISTDIPGCDNTLHFFLGEAQLHKIEII